MCKMVFEVTSGELFKTFGNIHNHIYANEGFSPQEAFNEFIKVLFIKIKSEKEILLQKKFNISKEEYNEIMDGKNKGLKRRVENIFKQVKKDYKDIFNESDILNLKETTLAFVINNLQKINFTKINNDIKGIAFQKFIFSNQRGDRGQFLTPDPVIELAVNLIKPTTDDEIIDPACGTGGFLIHSLRYIKNNSKDSKRISCKKLSGTEISPSVVKLAKIRMVLEGDGHGEIINADSLSDLEKLNQIGDKKFDLVLTNPPFGTQGKITDKTYLRRFELGHVWKNKRDSFFCSDKLQNAQTPEILFIERCLSLLKENGKLAIVLPDGVLENKTSRYVREFIKNKSKILAVVSLPSKTFIPHGTAIKTSIIFLQKKENKLSKEDYKIFFSIIEKIGYEGNKNGTPVFKEDGKGGHILDEDITRVIELFNKFQSSLLKEQNNLGFIRKFSELEDRLDAEFYKPEFKELVKTLLDKGAVPLNQVVEIKSKKAEILKNPNKEINYIEITNINPTFSEIVSSQKIKVSEAPSRATYELNEGNIITAVAGISTGTKNHATAIVTKEYKRAICTNGFRVLIPKKIDPYYLLYFLKSDFFLLQMLKYRIGAAIPSVIEEDLRKVLILIPDEKTQKKIVDKMKSIYSLREKAKNQFNELIKNKEI